MAAAGQPGCLIVTASHAAAIRCAVEWDPTARRSPVCVPTIKGRVAKRAPGVGVRCHPARSAGLQCSRNRETPIYNLLSTYWAGKRGF